MKQTFAQSCIERAEKATPGPWEIVSDLPDFGVSAHESHFNPDPVVTKNRLYRAPWRKNYGCSESDAEFIANARTDVPELARRLQRALDFIIEALPYSDHAQSLVDELEAMPE